MTGGRNLGRPRVPTHTDTYSIHTDFGTRYKLLADLCGKEKEGQKI